MPGSFAFPGAQAPEFIALNFPKDPAVLKIVRIVNSLRVVFLVRQGDFLSRRTLCGHQFPGNYRHFPSPRRVCSVVNLGGVVKTLRRSNFTIFAIAVVFLVRKGPLGKGTNLRGQTEPKRRFSQILADFCRFSQIFLENKAFGKRRFSQKTADFRRIFAENRRNPQKTADWRLSP